MLQNAKGQLLLILLLVAGSVWAIKSREINLGLDLSGGTELIYTIEFDKEMASDEQKRQQLLETTVSIIRDRIDPDGVLDAQVLTRGVDGIYIALPGLNEQEAEEVERKITRLGTLRMQVCAYDNHPKTGVKQFDLQQEKTRLENWIKKDDNKQRLLKDPLAIDAYHALSEEQGGRMSANLEWVPHKIEGKIKGGGEVSTDRDFSYSTIDSALARNVVTLFERNELSEPVSEEKPFLLEYLPIDNGQQGFTGEDLKADRVMPSTDPQTGGPTVVYELIEEKKDDYYKISGDYIGHNSAIILDGFIKSAPHYVSAIPGNGMIQGFTRPEAQALSDILKRGSLKVKPQRQSKVTIGPTLGRASIERGMYSIIIGSGLVLLFILFYYRRAGVVATVGILLNVGFVFGAVAFIGATLTLPGLGGLVLTIGMAVDANILIYERIREERRQGKNLEMAIRHGFERAMVTILDANVTTFIAGLVLYNFGVGPIRGFAVTLMIGIATSLFTAFFISRLIFHYMLEAKMQKLNMQQWFGGLRANFLKFTTPAFVISGVLIVAGIIEFFTVEPHIKYSLDFMGGADVRVVLKEPMKSSDIKDLLTEVPDFKKYNLQPLVNSVADSGERKAGGESTRHSIKLKVSDKYRAEVLEPGMKQAKEAGQVYEPPYVAALQKALAGKLVPQAFTDTAVYPAAETDRVALANVLVHYSKPVSLETVRKAMLDSARLGSSELVVSAWDGDSISSGGKIEDATEGQNLLLEFDVPKGYSEDQVMILVGEVLRKGELELSNPIPDVAEIGGRMVGELQVSAWEAMILALFFIVMYIRVRFQEFKYGFAAVCALIHDVLIALGAVVLANSFLGVNAELSLSMIAAFLTIIGYSINDTIVIFDRIRENLLDQARSGDTKKSFADTVNLSINQTLARTILTSCTTLFVVGALFAVNFGSGSDLEGFSFAMIIGVLTGTYSTIFIASPMVMYLRSKEKPDAGLSDDGGLGELMPADESSGGEEQPAVAATT